jgi:GTPase SAR1 family protein
MAQSYYDIGVIPETTELAERIILPYNELNYCLNGLLMDRITLLIAPTNSGKSCFSSSIIKSAITQGYNVFGFFGEDGGAEARDRIFRQHLEFDKENFVYNQYSVGDQKTNSGEYILQHDKFVEVNNFYKGHLFIYNNNLLATKDSLIGAMEEARQNNGCRLFLIDNAEMFELEGDNENKSMKEFCIALRQYAISKKVHILLVCHIKKTERNICRPEIFDAKGTSSLTNISKNIISLIRTDTLNPNTKEYKALKQVVEMNGYKIEECDAIIEVLKTKGRRNSMIGMRFNRISNSYFEATKYAQISNDTKPVLYAKPASPYTEISSDDSEYALPF